MLDNQENKFDLSEEVNYLNGAYMSPILKEVASVGELALRKKLRPYEIEPSDFFQDLKTLRQEFAKLIGCKDANQIVTIPSVSYGIATVCKNIDLNGKKVILTEGQFPSNVYPWMTLANSTGGSVQTIAAPTNAEHRGASWNEAILEAIDEHTGVVAIGHIHWADGTRFDLEAIRVKTRKYGSKLIIDATQSVGALPFDLVKFDPDALICAGYKWLMGPYGIGLAYYHEDFNDGSPLEENWINRKNSENFSALVDYQESYNEGALRFGVGEQSNFILVPMLLKALATINEWGVENIQQYCESITERPIEALKNLGFWVEDPAFRTSHLFGLRHPGLDAEHLATVLKAKKIFVSVRGDAIRVSPYVHNTEAQLFELVDVLKSCLHE